MPVYLTPAQVIALGGSGSASTTPAQTASYTTTANQQNANQGITSSTGSGGSINFSQGGTSVAQFTPSPAPTTTAGATNSATPIVPTVGTPNLNTSTAQSYLAGSQVTSDSLAQQQKDAVAQQLALSTKAATDKQANNNSLIALMGQQPTAQDNLNVSEQKFGVNEQQYLVNKQAQEASILDLQKQLASVQNAVSQAQSKNASGTETDYANNANAQIQRNAQPQINDLTAQINSQSASLAAYNGDFAQAEGFAQKAADALTADQKQHLDYVKALVDNNNQAIDDLTKAQQDAITANVNILTTQYQQANSDAKAVQQLMIDPNNAGAGILYNDSLATAAAKVAAWNKNPNSPAGLALAKDRQTLNTVPGVNVADASNRAGMNASDFQTLPKDVQIFFSQTSDTNIAPYKQALADVSSGQQKLEDYNKLVDSWSVSQAVKDQFKSWGATAAQSAPASSGLVWWNPFTWI